MAGRGAVQQWKLPYVRSGLLAVWRGKGKVYGLLSNLDRYVGFAFASKTF